MTQRVYTQMVPFNKKNFGLAWKKYALSLISLMLRVSFRRIGLFYFAVKNDLLVILIPSICQKKWKHETRKSYFESHIPHFCRLFFLGWPGKKWSLSFLNM